MTTFRDKTATEGRQAANRLALIEQVAKSRGLTCMRAPDASRFCPEPGYLRSLAVWCGLTHAEIAKRLGVSIRTVERHLTDNPSAAGVHGYLLQYGMEMLFIHKAATTATLRRRAARLAPGGRRPKCHGGVSE